MFFAALALALGLAVGCTVPVIYPRTAEVAKPGALRIAGGANHGYAPGSVRERVGPVEPGAPAPIAHTYRGNAASAIRGGYTPVSLLFSYVTAELSAGLGVFRPCEVGALASMLRAGLELRCAVLDEQAGAPFALALAAGVQHRTLFINAEGFAFRGGLELSSHGLDVSPLFNAYLRYGPTMRLLTGSGMPLGETEWFPRQGVEAKRDELVLSLPIGLALVRGQHVIFAFVPEFTLQARNTQLRCIGCDGWEPTGFEQRWALYFTLVLTATIGGEPSGPQGRESDGGQSPEH
jgi:hypothetical protein